MRLSAVVLVLFMCVLVCGCGGGRSASSSLPLPLHGAGDSAITRQSAASVSYQALVAESNPIAYYRMNDTGTALADSGTRQLNGTYGVNVGHGGVALTSGAGSQSSLFAGSPAGSSITQNAATVATIAPFATAAASLTVEAWIAPAKLNQTGRYIAIASFGREAAGQAWVLQLSPQSTLNFWMKTKAGAAPFAELKSNVPLSVGKAHQVVASYDGSNQRLFVDGALVATNPATGAIDYGGITPQTALAIGGALGSTEPIFAGAISDVSIYGTALATTTIAQHFSVGHVAAPATPAPIVTPNYGAYPALVEASKPIAYYTLNDAASVMTDSSGHNLGGAYGAGVQHGGSPLTSAGDASSTFPGTAPGVAVGANAGTVPANAAFSSVTGVTVEAWVKPVDYNRTGAVMPIVSYGNEAIGSAWSLQLTAESRLSFTVKINGVTAPYLIASVPLVPGHISQVVASYDGATVSLYLNGSFLVSTPASGALNFSGIPANDGLAIGGATGGTLPVFNGAISDVSIFPTALTPAVIQNHYIVGQLVPVLDETPKHSDGFVDSIGVVTHVRQTGSIGSAAFSTFEALLKGSGIRHISDALTTNPAWYPLDIEQLRADGVRATLITNTSDTAQTVAAAIPAFGSAIEAVGGQNEPDLSGNPNWPASTRVFQDALWSTIKSNPATAFLPVLGPSLTTNASDTLLGNLSGVMDDGAMHIYFYAYNPGTSGWGSLHAPGVYGSISYNLNEVAIVSGARPVIATESGYGDGTESGAVDDRTLARYIPRLFLELFLNGVPRTTIYEFFDESGPASFHDFGLVRVDNTPKPSYYAVRSLIGVLSDPGNGFTAKPLNYALSGSTSSLQHLLLQKRDGTYELVLWLETPSYDPNARVDIAVPPQPVTLTLPRMPATARISTIGDSGSLQSAGLSFSGNTATIPIDDRVTIVTFK